MTEKKRSKGICIKKSYHYHKNRKYLKSFHFFPRCDVGLGFWMNMVSIKRKLAMSY